MLLILTILWKTPSRVITLPIRIFESLFSCAIVAYSFFDWDAWRVGSSEDAFERPVAWSIYTADFKKKLSFCFCMLKLYLRSLLDSSSWFQTLIGYLAKPKSFSTQNSMFCKLKLGLLFLKWSSILDQTNSWLKNTSSDFWLWPVFSCGKAILICLEQYSAKVLRSPFSSSMICLVLLIYKK